MNRRNFLIAGGIALASVGEMTAQMQTSKADCIFCKIVAGTAPAFKLWEDKHFLAFLDNKPIMPGHTLIVPKVHHSYLFDMSKDEYKGIFERVRILEPPLLSTMNARRIGLLVEGFGVDHVHVHMIPLTDRGQIQQKGRADVTQEEFQALAEKIRPAMNKK